MTKRLDLPRQDRRQIEALLRSNLPGVEVWAYGSRISGASHAASDLDLVLRSPAREPILHSQFRDLLTAFRESNIPILIQVQDWARLPENVHREIERDHIVLIGPVQNAKPDRA